MKKPSTADTPLTARQEKFCGFYFGCKCNVAEALVKAGYSEKTAHHAADTVTELPQVKRRLDELREQIGKSAVRTAEDVRADIEDVTRKATENGDLKTALKGLEMQAKILGMFTEKVKAETSGTLTVTWDDGTSGGTSCSSDD